MGLKFIDFFSGIGGFRLGMEMAGHECVGHCEIDKFADKSYRAMHDVKESEWYANDIRGVSPGDLPDAECYCGGFPCQAFSIAGKRGGFEDTRGTLFFEVMRLAAVRKPKYIFMENVAGLLSHDGGKTFGTILNTLGQLGYWYEYQVLNSKDFGVPQNRERVFIIGHLGGFSGRKVFPIFGGNSKNIKVVAKLEGSFRSRNDILSSDGISTCLDTMQGGGHQPKVMIIGKDGKEKKKDYASCLTGGGHSGGNHSDMDLIVQAVLTPDRLEKRQNGRRMKEPGEEMFTLTAQDRHGVMITEATKQGYDIAYEGDSINLAVPGSQTRRGRVVKGIANTLDTSCNQGIAIFDLYNQKEKKNGICGTLTASGNTSSTKCGTFGISNGVRIRRLTPRECFRLQGFPDVCFDRAAKVNSDSQLYKQAGNSVTVNVIYAQAQLLG